KESIHIKTVVVGGNGVLSYDVIKVLDGLPGQNNDRESAVFDFWPDWRVSARLQSERYRMEGKMPAAHRTILEDAFNDLLRSMKHFREKAPPLLRSFALPETIDLYLTTNSNLMGSELGIVNVDRKKSQDYPADCILLSPKALYLLAPNLEQLLVGLMLDRQYRSSSDILAGLYQYYAVNKPALINLLKILQRGHPRADNIFLQVYIRLALRGNALFDLDHQLGNSIAADLLSAKIRFEDIMIRDERIFIPAEKLIDFVLENYTIYHLNSTGTPPCAVEIFVRDDASSNIAALILKKNGLDTWSLAVSSATSSCGPHEDEDNGEKTTMPFPAKGQYIEAGKDGRDGGARGNGVRENPHWGCADFRLRAVKSWQANRKQDARTIAMLIDLLGDEAWGVRNAAKAALIDIGEPAIGALAAARSDIRPRVAEGAAAALKEIITKEARIDHERDNNVRAQEIGNGWKEPAQNGPRKEFKLDGGDERPQRAPLIISRHDLAKSFAQKPLFRVLISLVSGDVSRSAIVRSTGMSESTVKQKLNKLIELGIIERRPHTYALHHGVSFASVIERDLKEQTMYHVLIAVEDGNSTRMSLKRATGFADTTIAKHLKALLAMKAVIRDGYNYTLAGNINLEDISRGELLKKPMYRVFSAIACGNNSKASITAFTGIGTYILDRQLNHLVKRGLIITEERHYAAKAAITSETAMDVLVRSLIHNDELVIKEDLSAKIVSIRKTMSIPAIKPVTRELGNRGIGIGRRRVSRLFRDEIKVTDNDIKTAMLATGSPTAASRCLKAFHKSIDRQTIQKRSSQLAETDPQYASMLQQTSIPDFEAMIAALLETQGDLINACRILWQRGYKIYATDPQWEAVRMECVWHDMNELERICLGLAVHVAPEVFSASDLRNRDMRLGRIILAGQPHLLSYLAEKINAYGLFTLSKVSRRGSFYTIEEPFRSFIFMKMPENPEHTFIRGVPGLKNKIKEIIDTKGLDAISIDIQEFSEKYPLIAAYYDDCRHLQRINKPWRAFLLEIDPSTKALWGSMKEKKQ
ncbi:MAG: hypothetical protein WC547_10230, partial [Candidatus Omnitrophota bacterium]